MCVYVEGGIVCIELKILREMSIRELLLFIGTSRFHLVDSQTLVRLECHSTLWLAKYSARKSRIAAEL